MSCPLSQHLFSIEQECQTTVLGSEVSTHRALVALLDEMSRLAPSIPGARGLFNGYGRVYWDTNSHLELAACEADCPYRLAQLIETQYDLARQATEALRRKGTDLLLVNNNHSGLLRRDITETSFWGTHENVLVHRPPAELTDLMLPFLVTRIYAGSGAVLAPGAVFLAGARPLAMTRATGGSTTQNRAIYSTCRDEPHLGPEDTRYRLHLLPADGHRALFNTTLLHGATALAVKAVQFDPALPEAVRRLAVCKRGEGWVTAFRRLNRLASPGAMPAVDPSAVTAQRVYLDAARRTVEVTELPPPWTAQILGDWQATLDAYERQDRAWLSRRLDAFIKYELYTHVLAEWGRAWRDLPGDIEALSQLALLDHDYHTISRKDSLFAALEADGLLEPRAVPMIAPGSEADPFVPEVATRARARARFIKQNAHRHGVDLMMTWNQVHERNSNRIRTLYEPFAEAYEAA